VSGEGVTREMIGCLTGEIVKVYTLEKGSSL
jgi:hypothetical protein